ncbi:iron-containing alcohol dehydrogenase [Lentilitoribacter sp. Alg239-R112]|uniref:iron-containing alcohol dehydrogenase n=1 Tax=Lentilitoribacter sp. Alg239-R112 TaxID=2305987 RepID=UPI0013A707C4|nr:iron-containing alcohol dehydrogenase [Lentilitoribacter sp. Alg239-R112]
MRHYLHHGLCELDDVHDALHGEKVAIGVLAGLFIQGRLDEFDEISSFCRSVRLPTTLSEIGIIDPSDDKLARVAMRSCQKGEIIHNEPQQVSEEEVVSALRFLS